VVKIFLVIVEVNAKRAAIRRQGKAGDGKGKQT
jgi:hypothetical protein